MSIKKNIVFLVILLMFLVLLRNCSLWPTNFMLLSAAAEGNNNKIDKLLTIGGNPNISDLQGITPLMLAANRGHVETVRLLIEHGADVNARSSKWDRQESALHIAILNQHLDIARMLIESSGDINALTGDGITPLMYAVSTGNKDLGNMLITRGADVNIKDKLGQTALMRAQKQNDLDTVQILKRGGAAE